MRIYHNPRCSKSREARQLCEDAGVELEIVEYLKTPPDEVELKELLGKLGLNAHGGHSFQGRGVFPTQTLSGFQ